VDGKNMKQIIIVALCSFVIIGCHNMGKTLSSVESLSPEEVNAQIESLRKFIIPTKGVSKTEVDAIFGVPEEIKERPSGGIILFNFPLHIYQLIEPEQNQEFRAFLYVNYKDDKVAFSSINHYCVAKNRAIYPEGSPSQIKEQKAIDGENRLVLEDLIEIQKKYENKLKNASWNKQASEQSL
jgi:hypothetical protein